MGGLQSWSVLPGGGAVGPTWNALSLVWEEAGSFRDRAKPDSRGSLAEKMALRGVCRKEPAGLCRGCRQVRVRIPDTLAGGFQED